MKKSMQMLLMLLLVSVMVIAGCSSEEPVVNTYEGGELATPIKVEAKETESEPEVVEEEPVVVVVENENLTEYPYTFTDKFGNDITIESKPETYVSFAPEITETIFELGVGENLVGRSSYCDYPSEALDVADMGTLFEFSIEAVIEASPDVVFLSSMVSEETYVQLIDNGLIVAVFDYDSNLSGTMDQITNIAAITNRIDQGMTINDRIVAAIEDLTAKASDREKKTLYFAVGVGEYTSTATGDTFMHDIIQAVGITNVAADGSNWMYTVEQIVEDDPDYVICSNKYEMKEKIESLEGYKDLRAVTEGKLYEIDENIFFRQGPRVVEAMYVLEALVYQAN